MIYKQDRFLDGLMDYFMSTRCTICFYMNGIFRIRFSSRYMMHTTLSVLIEQWFDRQPIVPRCERSIDCNIVICMFHHDVPACITMVITGLFALTDV